MNVVVKLINEEESFSEVCIANLALFCIEDD